MESWWVKSSRLQKVFAFLPGFVWGLTITYFSLIRGREIPSFLLSFKDLLLHGGMYFTIYVLYYMGLIGWNFSYLPPKKVNQWLLVGLGIAAGGILEILQETVAIDRSGTWEDLAANSLGALAGFGLMRAVHRGFISSSET